MAGSEHRESPLNGISFILFGLAGGLPSIIWFDEFLRQDEDSVLMDYFQVVPILITELF